MEALLVVVFSSQIQCLAKVLLQSYCPECSWTIGSLKRNISKKLSGFLFEDKHKSFLLVGAIGFGMRRQACPKYSKQQVFNIFVIFQERGEG